MNSRAFWILIALVAASANAADAPSDAGVAAIESLGRLNGQSLACSEAGVSARAKELMLKHAPRTSRYGTAFEQSTQRGFMEQVKSQSVCPPATELSQRLDAVAALLDQKLPPVQ